jgi:hypothetical protein
MRFIEFEPGFFLIHSTPPQLLELSRGELQDVLVDEEALD